MNLLGIEVCDDNNDETDGGQKGSNISDHCKTNRREGLPRVQVLWEDNKSCTIGYNIESIQSCL